MLSIAVFSTSNGVGALPLLFLERNDGLPELFALFFLLPPNFGSPNPFEFD